MFERYTESARRALFFSRYELSQLGGSSIEPAHLLLGLLRESKTLVGAIFSEWKVPLGDLRQQLENVVRGGERFSSSVEVPFTESAKRVLNFAAEEADRLLNHHIEPEHLLLGLIRERDSAAATSLTRYGLPLEDVREYIVKQSTTQQPASQDDNAQSENAAAARHALASVHIQRIMELVRDLAGAERNSARVNELVEQVDTELMMLSELWK